MPPPTLVPPPAADAPGPRRRRSPQRSAADGSSGPTDTSGAAEAPAPPAHAAEPPGESGEESAADLTFRQAQAALELVLAQLQATDLDVEAMAGLHRRALAYADRCAALLEQVEQEVMQWDPTRPQEPPTPYSSP